jgi:hypothetical protein
MVAMENDLDSELRDWLIHEMAENRKAENSRSRGALPKKYYSQEELVSALKADAPLKDHWGTSALIDCLRQSPAVLRTVEQNMANHSE